MHAHPATAAARVAMTALGVLVLTGGLSAQPQDARLATERARLLQGYGNYKRYGLPASDVYTKKLDRERRAVFDATVRALFQDIEVAPGQSTGVRLIDFVDQVQGIWGPRPMDPDGRHMFRLSVLWKPGLEKVLIQANSKNSGNIGKSRKPHLLEPVQTGGDDDPAFAGFTVRTRGLRTYRQAGHPSIQISFVASDQRMGEVDVDFHPWYNLCHDTPSNSDAASLNGGHSHEGIFDVRYAFFGSLLQLNWSSARHCQPVY